MIHTSTVTKDVAAAARHVRITASNVGESLEDAKRRGGVANSKPWTSRRFAEHTSVNVLKHLNDLRLLPGQSLDVYIKCFRPVLAVLACNHDAAVRFTT